MQLAENKNRAHTTRKRLIPIATVSNRRHGVLNSPVINGPDKFEKLVVLFGGEQVLVAHWHNRPNHFVEATRSFCGKWSRKRNVMNVAIPPATQDNCKVVWEQQFDLVLDDGSKHNHLSHKGGA